VSSRACAADDGVAVCVRIASRFADDIRRRALSQAVKTVRERVDEDGVAEPTVIQKDDQIIVELPGLAEEATSPGEGADRPHRQARVQDRRQRQPGDEGDLPHVGSAETPRDPEAIDQGIKAYADAWGAEKSGEDSSTTTS
jgi:preprotein translocase subunit SecD